MGEKKVVGRGPSNIQTEGEQKFYIGSEEESTEDISMNLDFPHETRDGKILLIPSVEESDG